MSYHGALDKLEKENINAKRSDRILTGRATLNR